MLQLVDRDRVRGCFERHPRGTLQAERNRQPGGRLADRLPDARAAALLDGVGDLGDLVVEEGVEEHGELVQFVVFDTVIGAGARGF